MAHVLTIYIQIAHPFILELRQTGPFVTINSLISISWSQVYNSNILQNRERIFIKIIHKSFDYCLACWQTRVQSLQNNFNSFQKNSYLHDIIFQITSKYAIHPALIYDFILPIYKKNKNHQRKFSALGSMKPNRIKSCIIITEKTFLHYFLIKQQKNHP